jgi:hypothetical protein
VYLRIFETKVVRKMYYGPIKEGDHWRKRANKEIREI